MRSAEIPFGVLVEVAKEAIKRHKPTPAPSPEELAEFIKESLQAVVENSKGSQDPEKLIEAYRKFLQDGIEVEYTRRSALVRFFLGDKTRVVKRLVQEKIKKKRSRKKSRRKRR